LDLRTVLVALAIPLCASAQQCKQIAFSGSVRSESGYSYPITPNLRFRLTPLKDDWGWTVSVGPRDSEEDWVYPVTYPRAGEQQIIGTGYGSSVQDKMSYSTAVWFVLTESDFIQSSKIASEPTSEDNARKVAQIGKGQVTVKPLKYGKGDSPETIKWMSFRASVVVPRSFPARGSRWISASCPPFYLP